jgi:putative PIN family toxin of toxin-antitoxin system
VESRRDLLAVWKDSALFVPSSVIRLEVSDCRDASDNKFLELDWAVEAKFLVTGDPDLLELDPWRGIRVIALKEFIENH